MLSLCMIAKNEADFIGQALASVRNLVDEIIVVDTGSDDDTPAIAASLGARVLHRPWDGDFSSARNCSLEAATGDWVLVLDADEAIAEPDHAKIRRHLVDRSRSYSLVQRHYTNNHRATDFKLCRGQYPEWERNYSGYGESRLCRLFPHGIGLCFTGNVYEFVEPSIQRTPGLSLALSPVPIHHYGHTDEVLRKKKKIVFYAELLEEKARNDDNWRSWYELGAAYFATNRLLEAKEAFARAYEKQPGELALLMNYGQVLERLGERSLAIDMHNQALAINHLHPGLHHSVATIYMRVKRVEFAEAHLRRAVELHPEFVNAYCSLGHLLISLHRTEEAVGVLEQALDLQPGCADAQIDLAAAYDILGRPACSRNILDQIQENALSGRQRLLRRHLLNKSAPK